MLPTRVGCFPGVQGRRGRGLAPGVWLLGGVLVAGCASGSDSSSAASSAALGEACGAGQAGGPGSAGAPGQEPGPDDPLTPLRLLRRSSIALLGEPPTDEQQAKLLAVSGEQAQLGAVDAFIDQALKDTRFYRTAFELAMGWFALPPIPRTADAPEYGAKQQRVLVPCKPDTAQAGKMHYYRDDASDACDASSPSVTIEPWWAPGTMVTLVGNAANTTNQGTTKVQGNPVAIECNGQAEGTCGCGPAAQSCWFDGATYPGFAPFLDWNPEGQRRLLMEEPARLFAHIVWHDREATDLVLSDYSVGPTEVQVAYVRQAIAGGDLSLTSDDRWWRPSRFSDAPTDPLHQPGDPAAWREYVVSQRNTFFLADRGYRFDPRQEGGTAKGIPSAGALTSLGFLNAYPRERLRAARALETFGCEQLLPPASGIKFNPYKTDPASEGPCQNCHTRIDAAAIHFKRFGKHGSAFEGWGARYLMPGVGQLPFWQWQASWATSTAEPFAQWNKWYRPGSLLTPATAEQLKVNPSALFLDFLPPEFTMLGQVSDGTIGPLGFAKMLVATGNFDRCVVRHVHERVVGRDIDPTSESGYLEALTQSFVAGGRKVRPFIKSLTQSEIFRRGH